MGDPFLNYFALGVLYFVVVVLFYGIIAIPAGSSGEAAITPTTSTTSR
ncbi:hypothetical protein BH10PSE6_BH10PSE6_01140 [soil metagenome]